MKGIIKAQFFQIVRDKVIRGMFMVALLMQVLVVMLPIWLDTEAATTAGEFFATQSDVTLSFPMFFLIVVTGQICGADFLDKTHNYELMIGHRRHGVYLGRVIPALLTGGIGALLLTMLPIVIYASLYGWGTKVALGQVLLRWILMLFPFLRMVCEFAFLTFLIKNPYVVMGLGYVAFMVSAALSGMMEACSVFLGITNLSLLLVVSKWTTYGLGDDINYIFDASLSGEIVWGTVAASVVIGLVALYLGYVFFKNDDMN